MKKNLSQSMKVDRRYYLATEKNFLSVLDTALKNELWSQALDKETKVAALLLGNSYILKVIASLPDEQFDTIYICDSDKQVLDYTEKLISYVKESSDYNDFKSKISLENTFIVDAEKANYTGNVKHILDYKSYNYDYEAWLAERFLDATLFNICKQKIEENKFRITFKHGYIQNVQYEKPVGLINFSNVHNFIGNKHDPKIKKHINLCSRLKLANKLAIISSEIPASQGLDIQNEVRLNAEYCIIDKRDFIGYKYFVQNKDKGRYHFFEVQGKNFQKLEKKEYRQLKGDHLKSKILGDFQDSLATINSSKELEAFEKNIKTKDEYRVLAYGQGIMTSIFHLNTSSVKVLAEMINQKRKEFSLFIPSLF